MINAENLAVEKQGVRRKIEYRPENVDESLDDKWELAVKVRILVPIMCTQN